MTTGVLFLVLESGDLMHEGHRTLSYSVHFSVCICTQGGAKSYHYQSSSCSWLDRAFVHELLLLDIYAKVPKESKDSLGNRF